MFYALNLLFAAVLALPFVTVFAASVSKSIVGSSLVSGFSYRWYVEFIHANGRFFTSLTPQIIVLCSMYVIMEVFLAGGFYLAFGGSETTRVSKFFSNGASRFFPLLVVTIIEVSLLFILYNIGMLWAAAGKEAAVGAAVDSRVFHADLSRLAVIAIVFVAINMLSDFIRVAVALDGGKLAERITRGVSFVFRHPLSSGGLYLGCTAVSAAVIALYSIAGSGMRAVDESTALVQIALAQIFILLRIFSKLIFYAGEAILYKENQIEVIQVKPEMLE